MGARIFLDLFQKLTCAILSLSDDVAVSSKAPLASRQSRGSPIRFLKDAAFGLPQPCSGTDMFGQWLMSVSNELKSLSATATC